jgi:hypothetical protein
MTDRGSTIAYYSMQHHKDPGIVGFRGTGYPIMAMDEVRDAYYVNGDPLIGPPNEGRNNPTPVSVSGLITIAGVPQPFFNVRMFDIHEPGVIFRGTRTDGSGHYRFNWMLSGDYEIVVRDPDRVYRTKIIHVLVP